MEKPEFDKRHELFKQFINFLVNKKHIHSPNVMLFYAIMFAKSDSESATKVKEALENGANPNITDKQIMEQYSDEFDEFKNIISMSDKNLKDIHEASDNHDVFKQFIEYLVNEKKKFYPDIIMFKAVFDDNVNLLKKALDAGANPNITDIQLMKQYSKEFEEFKNKYNSKEKKKNITWGSFINYLVCDKHILDPDLLFHKAILDSNSDDCKEALENGANPEITENEIIKRYTKEYEEFLHQ